MSAAPHTRTLDHVRRARLGTAALFFLTGAVFGTWATRIPAVQERLALSPSDLSVALVGVEVGALAGLPAGGRVVARIGSTTALRIGFGLFPAALVVAALAPTLAALVAALAAMGAGNSLIDVAMNVQGIELERRARRPLLSRLHSGHSFGVLAGGLAGTALAARDVPAAMHFVIAAACAFGCAQIAGASLVDERGSSPRPPTRDPVANAAPADPFAPASAPADRHRPRGALTALGLVAFAGFFVEGAANDWSAVHARDAHHAGAALAAATFTTFSLTLALVRVAGDRIVAKWGRARSVRRAGLLAAAGAGAVVVAPSGPAALGAWAVLGAGIATIAPTVLGAAPSATTAPPARAVATVSMIGYAGSFSGPPVIGFTAGLASLDTALGTLTLAALAIALLGPGALAPRRGARRRRCADNPAVLRSDQRTTGP